MVTGAPTRPVRLPGWNSSAPSWVVASRSVVRDWSQSPRTVPSVAAYRQMMRLAPSMVATCVDIDPVVLCVRIATE